MEKCDEIDNQERIKLEQIKQDNEKIKGMSKLKKFLRPKMALYIGVLFLILAQ